MKTETTKEHFPDLSFDGCGINGRDEYRTRIATFSNDADKYGKLFAAAPDLLEALSQAMELLRHSDVKFKICNSGRGNLGETSWYCRVEKAAREAIDKAKGL